MATPRRPLLGHLLVTEGLVTRAQLGDALRAQAEPPHTPFELILVERQVITQAQLNAVLDTYHRKSRLGAVLVEMKILTDRQLQRALQHQKKTGRRLGDALLELGLVSERQMKEAVCRQFGFRFLDLDGITLDPSLASLVEQPYAREHRVVPIARTEDQLTVAMDDPTDVDVVEALAGSTGCEIDVVTSTTASFRRAFASLYGSGVSLEPPAASAPAGSGELEARHAETVRALRELQASHEAVRAERDAAAAARRELEARQAETVRALRELQASHEAVRAERDAGAARRDLEARDPEAVRGRAERGAVPVAPPSDRTSVAPSEAFPAEPPPDAFSTWVSVRRTVGRLYKRPDKASPARPEPEARYDVSPPPAASRELENRLTEATHARGQLEAAHAALRAERDAGVRALGELEARHAETARALAELKTAHAALRAERDAGAQALRALEARHAETARALAELAAHRSLQVDRAARATGDPEAATADLGQALARSQAEREANAQALRELRQRHTDVLLALKTTQDALARERDPGAREEGDAKARETTRILTELQASHDAVRAERDAATRALAELGSRHAETTRVLAELRATHEHLLQDRAADAQPGQTAQRALKELKAAQDALVLEREAGEWARQELQALRRQQEALRREHEAALRMLRGGRP